MRKPSHERYLQTLQERRKEGHVYQPFQQAGLDIAEILGDMKHKALYIKLAKEHNPQTLLSLAKDVAERRGVKNKGAYFMKVFYENLNNRK
ncbi:MAG: hypothetical protein AAB967_02975 [Patescibacteria group bacterium]